MTFRDNGLRIKLTLYPPRIGIQQPTTKQCTAASSAFICEFKFCLTGVTIAVEPSVGHLEILRLPAAYAHQAAVLTPPG